MIIWIREKIYERRVRLAMPTIQAMAKAGPTGEINPFFYARSVDRLWLDGGSVKGFHAAVRLGWAVPMGYREGELYGAFTDKGREMLNYSRRIETR